MGILEMAKTLGDMGDQMKKTNATPQSPTPTLAPHSTLPFRAAECNVRDSQDRLVAQLCCRQDTVYLVDAVNAHAALQAENAELREILKRTKNALAHSCADTAEADCGGCQWYKHIQQALTRPPEVQ